MARKENAAFPASEPHASGAAIVGALPNVQGALAEMDQAIEQTRQSRILSGQLWAIDSNAGNSAVLSDAKLFANRSALFANDAESAMIACSLL